MKKNKQKNLFIIALSFVFGLTCINSYAETARYIVKFKANTEKQVLNTLKQHGEIKLKLSKHDAVAVTLPEAAIKGLEHNPNIEYIEVDPLREWLLQEVPYAIPMIQADLLDDSLTGSQKICVIDSGLDITHEDIAGNQITSNGNALEDTHGHGTFMVSAIAAVNNDVGVLGVAPNGHIQIHMLTIWDRYGSSFIKALDNCQAAGANIVTMSAGSATVSKTEARAFKKAYANGVLMMAAAGNNGDTTINYPGAYPEVIAVGAVDKNKQHAFFSVQNAFVELMAPGWYAKGAWTTQSNKAVMLADLTVNGVDLDVTATGESTPGSVTATVVECGDGLNMCPNAVGNICLITATKSKNVTDEVRNCEAGGGVGAIVHGDEFIIAYNEGVVNSGETMIPTVNIRDVDAASLRTQLGITVTLNTWDSLYKEAYGTSFSSPLVAAAAALVWSYHQDCTNEEIRNALVTTAEDGGVPGRDDYYGYGLVQAKAAKDYLDMNGCGGDVIPPTGGDLTLSVSSHKTKGKYYADLSWSDALSTNVDIYRDGNLILTQANDGSYSERVSSSSYQYQVCEAGTTTCSAIIILSI